MNRERRLAMAAVAVVGVHNVVQNQWLNERGYVPGNLAVTGLLIALGRRAGLRWSDMGLHPDDAGAGLRLGAVVGAGVSAGIVLVSRHPRWIPVFHDRRARIGSEDEVWRRALVRFPVGTALFEEVAFRGVMPALLRRMVRPVSAELVSAGLFGVWHIIPTRRVLVGNAAGSAMSSRQRRTAPVIGSTAAAVAGLGFAWMRRHTRSVAAPWLAHAVFNTTSFLVARATITRR